MKKIIFKKIAKINNFFVYHFNKINEFIKIINIKFKNISSFNRYLIFLITILFLYLFYLSIPSLYNQGVVQTKLNKMINNEYNINVSLSSDLNYNILPRPHIIIKNAKFYTNDLNSPKEIGQIKKLKIFISQKNLFKIENIEIKKIIFDEANFSIQQEDFKYIKKFIKNKFSKKKFDIINSNFFYKDNNENVVTIFPVSKFSLFFDEKNLKNLIISKGEIFTIPYILNWNRNFKNNLNSTSFKVNKLNLRLESQSKEINSDLLIKNFIFFRNLTMETDILFNKDFIEINSFQDPKIKNNKLSYAGKIDINPFNFTMNINLDKLNFKKNIFYNDLLQNLFELKHFYNENLNSKITIQVNNLTKNKIFSSAKMLLNLNNGDINFNDTIFKGALGTLNLINSDMTNFKDDLIFNGNFKFRVDSANEFYRLFQISKSKRKKINNIYFDLKINLTKNTFKLSNLIFDPGKIEFEDDLLNFLDDYNEQNNKVDSWVDFQKFVNTIFSSYYSG